MTGLPPARAGAQKQLDELHRWPDNRVALTATVLSLFLAVEELPTDSATNLLVQLHTRYLGGEGDKASHGSAVEDQEDQPSLAAGTELMDEAGQPAGVPTTTVDPEAAFTAAREAGRAAGQANLQRGTAAYNAAMLAAGVHPDSQLEHDWDAGYRHGLDMVLQQAQPQKKRPAARYRCPTTGQTWTGRGLKPRWLAQALDAGAALADFGCRHLESPSNA